MNIHTTDDDDWVLVDAPPPGERKQLPADYWEQEAIDTEPTNDDNDWVLVDSPPSGENKELPAEYWEQETIDTEPTPEQIEAEAYIDRQAELFEEYRQKLVTEYNGLYVLFEDGKVLDADKNQTLLIMRAEKKYGGRSLFVEKVLPEPPPPLRIIWHPY